MALYRRYRQFVAKDQNNGRTDYCSGPKDQWEKKTGQRKRKINVRTVSDEKNNSKKTRKMTNKRYNSNIILFHMALLNL